MSDQPIDPIDLCTMLENGQYEKLQEMGIDDVDDACDLIVFHYQNLHQRHARLVELAKGATSNAFMAALLNELENE